MKVLKSSLIGLVATAALIASTTVLAKKPSEQYTILDLAFTVNADTAVDGEGGEFSTLLFVAGLYPEIVSYLDGRGQRTLFAPTDEAFSKLDTLVGAFCYDSVVDLYAAEPDYVEDVLLYHVTQGRLEAAEVLPKDQIRMLSGDFVTREPGTVVLADALAEALNRYTDIVLLDQEADNGIIHAISEVLLPYPPMGACPPAS